MKLFKQALGIRENVAVPQEARPLERLHPETVKMEHGERDFPLDHAVDKGENGFLIIVGGKRRGQPQAVRPLRQLRRPSRQSGVGGEDVLRRVARKNEILHFLAGNRELRLCGRLAANLIRDAAGGIDKHPVTAAAEEERHVLVRLLAVSTSVGVPQIDTLAVLHKGAEALAETVDIFPDGQLEPLAQIRLSCSLIKNVRHPLRARCRQKPSAPAVLNPPALPGKHARLQLAAAQEAKAVRFARLGPVRAAIQREARHHIQRAAVICQTHGDGSLSPGSYPHRKQAAVERIAPVLHCDVGTKKREAFPIRFYLVNLAGTLNGIARPRHPHTVRKFHQSSSFAQTGLSLPAAPIFSSKLIKKR